MGICFFPSINLFLNWTVLSYLEYVMVHVGRNMLYNSLSYSDEGFYRRYTSSMNGKLLLDKKLLPLLKKDPSNPQPELCLLVFAWREKYNIYELCDSFCLEQSILSVLDMGG